MNKLIKTYHYVKNLPSTINDIRGRINELQQSTDSSLANVTSSLDSLQESLSSFQSQVENLKQQHADTLNLLSRKKIPSQSAKPEQVHTKLQADNHELDGYYLAFEDKFRGSEEAIYLRLKESYSNFLKELPPAIKNLPLIDIGCGRGELLRLYKEFGLKAVGVDLNETMVQKCKNSGYNAEQINAVDYLKGQPSSSLGGISGIHIAEHIPFEELIELLREAFRTVVKGGFILLETPNPENLTVGALNFWYDSSHLKPLPPDVLAFMLEYVGFGELRIQRMQPEKTDLATIKNTLSKEIATKLYGPRDYAVIGRKYESRASQIKQVA